MDIQLGGIIYLLFYFHAGAFHLEDREKRRGGQRGTQKQKGRICMQLQSYQQSKRGARVFINRVFCWIGYQARGQEGMPDAACIKVNRCGCIIIQDVLCMLG
ncbi:uncharacterized protein K444DRAFT_173606 [Hyaloscypha bicolor E]|uniref:Uncharacterized protein n=1 Tax=Hyaloscypha bicolor E TaxID=1095630 RepID=A0A2J6TQ92_9HELO|nr:uncharacterized protein K444DRAFT_173606 [Hyaloscypha bicolor E]PMD65197.1 hypothetical protein K444DRAFT_173606 [Hyaloscypha bicolor E]